MRIVRQNAGADGDDAPVDLQRVYCGAKVLLRGVSEGVLARA